MPRGRRIAYKLHVITENITKHDDSLSKEGGKPKTGLNCLYNFNNEKRHYKYKASYQIGTKSTNIWSKKKERAEKVKKGKEKFHSLWKQKKKSMPCFPFPGRSTPCKGLWAGPIFGILQLETVDCETLHLFTPKTDKACLRDLCRANCFAREAQDIVWDFCTWGWMNLQLS